MHEDLKEEEIVNKVGGRFKLSTLIQKRMVALNSGARPLSSARNGRGRSRSIGRSVLRDEARRGCSRLALPARTAARGRARFRR